jgi:hypothetical protein
MLIAYLDESSDDRVYTVAGFMTTVESWQPFSRDWEAVLRTDPKISHFKMHGVLTSKADGVFKNYSKQQRIDKTESLVSPEHPSVCKNRLCRKRGPGCQGIQGRS